MRIIIAGGRDFNDYGKLMQECLSVIISMRSQGICNNINDIEVVSGRANGADKLGERFALSGGYKVKYFPADWSGLGKKAGYIRNEQMALYAKEDNGILIAFWDGKSKGTEHMINLANKHELQVFVINY
jgi:hypothetical protein